MDMFTDVDMFADILNAAARSVAVYILLDEQNAHHFVNMVSNCRVNLQSIQFLRVRTVSGITYHCRSGKSFKGQMMDRFLLTDCRAVLSGNYSFMWSFEKLNRCMAHLFLGQLVSTFDEEFRILFAQSQPLMIENVLTPMDEFSLLQKRQYPTERPLLYREPRKFLSLDPGHPEERKRHSYDEHMDVDWRMMPLKKQESLHGPSDMFTRFPPQQPRVDPSFDQFPSRMLVMENPAFKRHSYAEGVHGRFSYPFMPQQAMPEPENQGRQFHRGQQPYPGLGPGPEADYSGYDKFWNQDYPSADQYSEHGLPQEMQPSDNFDPVLNYLSSTRNVDFDQSSEKLLPAADLPFSSSRPKRLSLGQPYACQTSPTPSNPADQKQFFQEPNTDRKDPTVKQGLRNWRISSYLSAYDNPGDEGLPLVPPQAPDTFEEPSYPVQQTAPGIDLTFPKIPNVREFKVPAIPRASQMPNYIKTTVREQPKKLPDEPTAVATETKTTPTPSESSSTAEGEKAEEAEQKEPKTTVLRREESFRRKYNAAAPRSSRLRSSLIFSSLDQQNASQDTKTAPGQQEEESDKNEAEQVKLPFVSQVLGQRRSATREPFEWSRYIKSATFDNSATETSKPDDGNSKADDEDPSKIENSKDLSENREVQESLKPPDVEKANPSPSMARSKPSEAELPKTDQSIQAPKSLLTTPLYIDMNDPDKRLMFFKELAAKRKAAKAAEAEKSKEKAPMKPPTDLKNNTTVKKEEPETKEGSEKMANAPPSEGLSQKHVTSDDAGKTVSTEASLSLSSKASDNTNKKDGLVKSDPSITQSCKEEQIRVSAESEKTELKTSQSATSLPISAEIQSLSSEPPKDSDLAKPAVIESSPSHPPTPTNATPANVPSPIQGTDESESPSHDDTPKEPSSLTPSSVEVPLSSASAALDSNTPNPESVQLESTISKPAPLSEQTGAELDFPHLSVQSSSTDHISPSPSTSSPAPVSTPGETLSPNVTAEVSSSSPSSSMLSPKSDKTEAQQSVISSSHESSPTTDESSTESESTQVHLDPISQLTSSETPSAVDSAHVESDISPDACATFAEPNTSSLQSTTETNSEESCAPTCSEKDVPELENDSVPKALTEESQILESSKDVKANSKPSSLSPSSSKSGLPNVSDLESLTSRPDQTETIHLQTPPEHAPSEICSPVNPDITPNASQPTTNASPQDALKQATPPSELDLTGSVTSTPVETVSCSSLLTESVGSVLFPEAENTETNMSSLCSPSDTPSLPKQITTDSNETPVLPLKETSSPTEPTSTIPTEPKPRPESVTSESHPSDPPVPAETSKTEHQSEVSKESELPDPGEKKPDHTEARNEVSKSTTQESVISEKTNDQVRQNKSSELAESTSDEVVPPSPQSKQPKSSQSRYHSSTANVLSSSNLRDDTKLLLEQISANSQSRNEAPKESPVTDDEKEDEADKNAKREKERGIRTLSRGQPKSTQEKEKLLERIQSMRKERKVYSRFEMAP